MSDTADEAPRPRGHCLAPGSPGWRAWLQHWIALGGFHATQAGHVERRSLPIIVPREFPNGEQQP